MFSWGCSIKPIPPRCSKGVAGSPLGAASPLRPPSVARPSKKRGASYALAYEKAEELWNNPRFCCSKLVRICCKCSLKTTLGNKIGSDWSKLCHPQEHCSNSLNMVSPHQVLTCIDSTIISILDAEKNIKLFVCSPILRKKWATELVNQGLPFFLQQINSDLSQPEWGSQQIKLGFDHIWSTKLQLWPNKGEFFHATNKPMGHATDSTQESCVYHRLPLSQWINMGTLTTSKNCKICQIILSIHLFPVHRIILYASVSALTSSYTIWKFPEMGIPLVIIHWNVIFQPINQQFLGYPHDYGNPPRYAICTTTQTTDVMFRTNDHAGLVILCAPKLPEEPLEGMTETAAAGVR